MCAKKTVLHKLCGWKVKFIVCKESCVGMIRWNFLDSVKGPNKQIAVYYLFYLQKCESVKECKRICKDELISFVIHSSSATNLSVTPGYTILPLIIESCVMNKSKLELQCLLSIQCTLDVNIDMLVVIATFSY